MLANAAFGPRVQALYKYGILLDTADTPKGGGGSWWPPEDDRIRSVSLEVLVLAADQRLRQRKYRGGTPARCAGLYRRF